MPARRPDWFRVPAPGGEHTHFNKLQDSLRDLNLVTVCEEAQVRATTTCGTPRPFFSGPNTALHPPQSLDP